MCIYIECLHDTYAFDIFSIGNIKLKTTHLENFLTFGCVTVADLRKIVHWMLKKSLSYWMETSQIVTNRHA